jgi:two-component system sensor histidine kinase BaeS
MQPSSRAPRHRPPWWPENEDWPPRDGMHGAMAARFAARAAVALALLGGGAILFLVMAFIALHTGGPFAVFVLFLIAAPIALFVLIATVAAFGMRRMALPFGELIDAVGSIARGNYNVRVRELQWGPPQARRLVDAVNNMAERLEATERQRRTLLAEVSHELRTPLAVLRGELEAMADGIHPADEAHINIAIDETLVLARLVDDLRTLALAETGTLPLHREPVDLAVLLSEVSAAFESEASRTGVRINVALPEDTPIADLDPVRIREVLSNLLANALRYAPASSVIEVGLALDAPRTHATITVADAGPGIDPKVRERLFERFAKSADSRGSGLGLAIARGLVEAHGGTIAAEAPASGGTLIRVVLPLN